MSVSSTVDFGMEGLGMVEAGIDDLVTSSKYVLATIALDMSGSVCSFQDLIQTMSIEAIRALQRDSNANSMLVRVISFGGHGVQEVHPWALLKDIDVSESTVNQRGTIYHSLIANGGTPCHEAISNSRSEARRKSAELRDNGYDVAIVENIITDGEDTTAGYSGGPTFQDLAQILTDIQQDEAAESYIGYLLGINVSRCRQSLEDLSAGAKFTEFLDEENYDKESLAKIFGYVVSSISTASANVGSGQSSPMNSATSSAIVI